jgi:DNA-binding MarR family transcriptional regulator
MSDIPTVYSQFGQALGLAERTLSAVLREHLAQRNTVPEAWYTLRLLATRGPAYPRADLTRLLEGPGFDSDAAHAQLARLEADGLIRGDTHLDLTPEGEARYHDLREYISRPSVQLLSQFDVDDIETTVRTLQAITAKASVRSSVNIARSYPGPDLRLGSLTRRSRCEQAGEAG